MMRPLRSMISRPLLPLNAFAAILLGIASPGLAAQKEKPARVLALKVEPAAITLTNGRDQRRVVVSGRLPDGSWIDLTRAARFTVPAFARLDRSGFFVPVKPGRGEIVAS